MLCISFCCLAQDIEKVKNPAGTSSRSISDGISINPSFIELNPNEEADVEVMMTVPKEGYNTRWGNIFVEAAKEQVACRFRGIK